LSEVQRALNFRFAEESVYLVWLAGCAETLLDLGASPLSDDFPTPFT